jgi:hypothetical protein
LVYRYYVADDQQLREVVDAIREAGGERARLRYNGPVYVVWSDVEVDPPGFTGHVERVRHEDVEPHLTHDLKRLPFDGRRVSTSRGWSLAAREQEQEPTWEVVGATGRSVESVHESAEEAGYDPEFKAWRNPETGDAGPSSEFDLPWELVDDPLLYKRVLADLCGRVEEPRDAWRVSRPRDDVG